MIRPNRSQWTITSRGAGSQDRTSNKPISRQLEASLKHPLCVGLNGTLVYGNILWEAVLLLIKRQPLTLFLIPFWRCMGRASFAARVFKRVRLAAENLPYRKDVLAFLQEEKRQGRSVFLTTAADESLARSVAESLGCFDAVITDGGWSDQGEQSKAHHKKIRAIRQHLGNQAFAYLGHARDDLPVWAAATERLAVAPDRHVMAELEVVPPLSQVFTGHPGGSTLSGLFRALRPSQWAKNLLLAIPLLMSHQLGNLVLWWQLAVAFFAFSCCASAGYVINDLLDLEADRLHPHKRYRPFASGQVSIPMGIGVALGLGIIGVSMAAALLSPTLVQLLAIYLGLTFAYSLYCKRQLIMDAVVLAGLYTHRIVAGGAAVEVVPSPWLLAFSMFLFLSLAFAKRYAELLRLKTEAHQEAQGRGYLVDDLSIIGNLGSTSGYIAVLVFILYLNNSPDAQMLYANPAGLWLISPVLLYWISRVWLLVQRGTLHEDPVLFTLSDRVSYVCGILILLLILMAANGWILAL